MDSKRYKKLLKIQKLVYQRDLTFLSNALAEKKRVDNEKEKLIQMSERLPQEICFDYSWITKKIKNNAVKSNEVDDFVEEKKKNVQLLHHRCDILSEKYKIFSQKEERKIESLALSEYLNTKK